MELSLHVSLIHDTGFAFIVQEMHVSDAVLTMQCIEGQVPTWLRLSSIPPGRAALQF